MYYLPETMHFTRESGFLQSTKEEGKWTCQCIRHMTGMNRCRVRKGRDTTAAQDLRRTHGSTMWPRERRNTRLFGPSSRSTSPNSRPPLLLCLRLSKIGPFYTRARSCGMHPQEPPTTTSVSRLTAFFHTYSRFRPHRPSPVQCCAVRPTPFDGPPTSTCPVRLARNRRWQKHLSERPQPDLRDVVHLHTINNS